MVIQRESLSILTSDGKREIMRFDPTLGDTGTWIVYLSLTAETVDDMIEACQQAKAWHEKQVKQRLAELTKPLHSYVQSFEEQGNGNP